MRQPHRRRRLARLQHLKQQPGRCIREVVARLMDRGESRPDRARDVGVVESGDRKLRRHGDPHLMRGHQHTRRHVVVAREDRGRPLRQHQQLPPALHARIEHEVALLHVVRVDTAARCARSAALYPCNRRPLA